MEPIDRSTVLKRGALAGMIGGAAMAMFAMAASITYQDGGFFTPLFHISAVTGSPASMMTSMMEAGAGNAFWFTPGAAAVGLMIHMMTGALYGIALTLVVHKVPHRLRLVAGTLGGAAVFGISTCITLPLAARLTGSGAVVSDMPEMVGLGTFLMEHLLFGSVVGIAARATTPSASPPARQSVLHGT